MANPRNNVTLAGKVGKGGLHFLSDQKGEEFGCLMTLLVQRNYRSRQAGKYEKDPIGIKYVFKNDSCRRFAHEIKDGDGVIVAGTIRAENGKLLVYTEEVSYDDLTLNRKYPTEAAAVSSEEVKQKPLPY